MTETNPITPTPELVRKWIEKWAKGQMKGPVTEDQLVVATQAARWGADQELEAICEWLDQNTGRWDLLAEIRAARRPNPPSLRAQALVVLDDASNQLDAAHENIIRRALEALPE